MIASMLEPATSIVVFWAPPIALGWWWKTRSPFSLAALATCVVAWCIILIRAAAS